MFGQLLNHESLRDEVLATQVHANKAFHLGLGKHASKSTLLDANNRHDYLIFEEFAYRVVAEAKACRADNILQRICLWLNDNRTLPWDISMGSVQ